MALALFTLVFAVPELMNLHNTFAALGAVALVVSWLSWMANFLYRVHKETE